MDPTTLTDADLLALTRGCIVEQQRRDAIAQAPAQAEALAATYAAAIGRKDGDPYQPVTGAHDAYPLGATVTHDGKTWTSTRHGASGTPGDSPDWREVAEEGEVLPWSQPHAGAEYPVGAVVTHEGRTWRNDHTGPNGWQPGTVGSQWTDIGPA